MKKFILFIALMLISSQVLAEGLVAHMKKFDSYASFESFWSSGKMGTWREDKLISYTEYDKKGKPHAAFIFIWYTVEVDDKIRDGMEAVSNQIEEDQRAQQESLDNGYKAPTPMPKPDWRKFPTKYRTPLPKWKVGDPR